MGVLIGATEANSTWGRCRSPILKPYQFILGAHNLTDIYGWVSQANTFFRVDSWPYFQTWLDSDGNVNVEVVGPQATPSSPFPPAIAFKVSSINYDPTAAYTPNLLDDVEVQSYWVGRDVVIDGTTYTMAYSALDGVNGSFQSITSSTDVDSFDL
jgi:hypothetical protein